MSCFVYILKCADESYYTGISSDPVFREKQHNLRIKSCLQKSKLPAKIVFLEKHRTRIEAAKREKEIKGWKREKKQELISRNSLH